METQGNKTWVIMPFGPFYIHRQTFNQNMTEDSELFLERRVRLRGGGGLTADMCSINSNTEFSECDYYSDDDFYLNADEQYQSLPKQNEKNRYNPYYYQYYPSPDYNYGNGQRYEDPRDYYETGPQYGYDPNILYTNADWKQTYNPAFSQYSHLNELKKYVADCWTQVQLEKLKNLQEGPIQFPMYDGKKDDDVPCYSETTDTESSYMGSSGDELFQECDDKASEESESGYYEESRDGSVQDNDDDDDGDGDGDGDAESNASMESEGSYRSESNNYERGVEEMIESICGDMSVSLNTSGDESGDETADDADYYEEWNECDDEYNTCDDEFDEQWHINYMK